MQLLFTKSDRVGSKIIRWGLDEPVSHVGVCHDGIVLHSEMKGVDLDTEDTFLKNRTIIYIVELPELDIKDFLRVANAYENASYDFLALLSFGFYALRRKWFSTPFPKKNMLSTKGNFLCTEVASMLLWNTENAILTPYQLYKQIRSSNERMDK